jgi:hypothetical protein
MELPRVAWSPTCDERLKDIMAQLVSRLKKCVQYAANLEMEIDRLIWYRIYSTGSTKVFPDAVVRGQDVTLADGSVVEGVLSPDTYGVAAALHHEAILALIDEVNELKRMLNVEMKGN